MKILIVDDEVEVAECLAKAVAEQGHEALVAYDGAEALALLSRSRPDGIFLDVRLPGMSGVEVLRRIRVVDRALPVILVTGHALPEQLEDARRLGVTDVVEKLYVITHLSEALGQLNV